MIPVPEQISGLSNRGPAVIPGDEPNVAHASQNSPKQYPFEAI